MRLLDTDCSRGRKGSLCRRETRGSQAPTPMPAAKMRLLSDPAGSTTFPLFGKFRRQQLRWYSRSICLSARQRPASMTPATKLEGSTVAVRPFAACCALEKRSFADLAERPEAAFRCIAKIAASMRRTSVPFRCSCRAAANFQGFPPCADRHRGESQIVAGRSDCRKPLLP